VKVSVAVFTAALYVHTCYSSDRLANKFWISLFAIRWTKIM